MSCQFQMFFAVLFFREGAGFKSPPVFVGREGGGRQLSSINLAQRIRKKVNR